MPELVSTLDSLRDIEFRRNKFMAAIQGIDIGDNSNDKESQTTFEDIKARVFSGGQAKNADDIVSLQGINAQQAGFGIGMGLEYNNVTDLENPSW